MYTLKQLNEKVVLLINNTNDKSKLLYLNNLQKQIIEKEKFYNDIPDNIKTTSTIKYIIESLTFKLDQFTYKQSMHYKNINPNYEQENICDNAGIITLAYLTENGTQIQHQNNYITALNTSVQVLQTELDASTTRIAELEIILAIAEEALLKLSV